MPGPYRSVGRDGDPVGAELLSWDVQAHDGLAAAVVVVEGELDAFTAPWLGETLWRLAGSGQHLVVDLTGLRFLGCAGLTLFLRLRRRTTAAGGSLHLVGAPAAARRVIAVTRLADALPVADSVVAVLAELRRDGSLAPAGAGRQLDSSAETATESSPAVLQQDRGGTRPRQRPAWRRHGLAGPPGELGQGDVQLG